MKTQIENSLLIVDDNPAPLFTLNEIVQDCIRAKDFEHLRRLLDQTHYYSLFFKWGFGSYHFWLTQISDKTQKRILFIEK